MRAFTNEVDAQRGKHFQTDADMPDPFGVSATPRPHRPPFMAGRSDVAGVGKLV
jgi:hypothetical protein